MTTAMTTLVTAIRAAVDTRTGVGPGLIAFLIVVLLAVATYLLIRSMLRHIKKVPPTFDVDETDRTSGPGVGQ